MPADDLQRIFKTGGRLDWPGLLAAAGLVAICLLLTCSGSPLNAQSLSNQTSTPTSETTQAALPTSSPTPSPSPSPSPSSSPTPILSPTPMPTPEPPSDDHPVIALTFDDGPSLTNTPVLLDLLAAEDIKATFFVIGGSISGEKAALVKRAFDEGHEIANHTYSHVDLSTASAATIRDQLTKTNDIIYQITGQVPKVMRPPYGAFDNTTKAVCVELGLAIIHWTWQASPQDCYHQSQPDYIYSHVVENAANGYIILLHDPLSTTLAVMPEMIRGLKDRGFRFVTVSELLAYRGVGEPQSGSVYYRMDQ